MTLQDITIETYRNNFSLYKQKTSSVVSGEFVMWMDEYMALLPDHAKILELGSAEGRDARYLREHGHTILCTDVLEEALTSLRGDGFNTSVYDFRDEPKEEWIHAFDGIFAKAVYLHATQEIFEASLTKMGQCLRQGGIFCLTLKLGVGEEIETGKLGGERYFKYYTQEELWGIVGCHQQYEFVSMAKTSDSKWVQVLMRKL